MPFDSRAGRPTALLGSAKIDLRHLRVDLPADLQNGRLGEDKKNIARLISRFEQTRCRPSDPKNRVPILIEQSKLENILRLNNLQLTDLQRLPLSFLKEIPPDSGLLCLHGYHRLEAGRRYLSPGEDWWGVNIFSKEGTSDALEAQLRKSDNSAKPYDDGTVFYHARVCEISRDFHSAREWLAELPPSKLRDYRQLQRQDMMMHLRKAWDDLLVIPGIWNVLELGTFHRMLPMRCPEEQTHYVEMILSQFRTVFQDNPEQITHLDNGSAAILQGRSPCFSLEDTAHVQKASQDNELFANLPLSKRSKALLRVRQHDRMFLSIYTFLEDLKFLEAGSKPMAALLPRTWKGTIRQGFYKHFLYDSLVKQTRQVGDDEYVEISHPTKQAAFSDAYRTLFLYSFRTFPYLDDLKPRQTKRDPDLKLDRKRNRAECWVRFAKLAQRVCFSTPTIDRLSAEDANSAVAVDALKCAKPSSYYYAADLVDVQSQSLAGILKEVQPVKISKATPELTADSFQPWRLSMRCGRPFDQAFQWIERYGYLENVYTENVPDQKQVITHFTVFRDTFHAFFGRSLDMILEPLKEELEDSSNVPASSPYDHATFSDLFPESWVSSTSTEPAETTGIDQSRSGEAQRDAERLAYEQKIKDRVQAEAEVRITTIGERAALDARKASDAERLAYEQKIKDRVQAEAEVRITTISERAALDARKANDAVQRAQADKIASEQRSRDQADAERVAANIRIKKISDEAAAATAALKKATDDAAAAKQEKLAAELRYRQLTDQVAIDTAQRALAGKDKAIDVANSSAAPEDDILRIPPAPLSDAAARRRNRTPLAPVSMVKQPDVSSNPENTKKRHAEDIERHGIPRLTPPVFQIRRGALTGAYLQLRLGNVPLAHILENYAYYHHVDQKHYAKCLIRGLPDDENDIPDVFFFAESVHGKTCYLELIKTLEAMAPPQSFFDIVQENAQTKFVTMSKSIWDTRMIIAKPASGKSFVKHPNGKYNMSFWPQWNQTNGFVFSIELQISTQPSEPAQLQITTQPSTEPAQLQSTAQLQITASSSELRDRAQLQDGTGKKVRNGKKLEWGAEEQLPNPSIKPGVIKQKQSMKASKGKRKKKGPGQANADAEMEDHEDIGIEDHGDTDMSDHNDTDMEEHEDSEVGEHGNLEVNADNGKGYLSGAFSRIANGRIW